MRQRADGRVRRPRASRVPDPKAPRLCLYVDTTRTDHHPNNPSHPTPGARDHRERLDSAVDEGLSQKNARFLRFLGHADRGVTELQALGVPGKYGPIQQFTHVPSIEDAAAVVLEHEEGPEPVGSYVLWVRLFSGEHMVREKAVT